MSKAAVSLDKGAFIFGVSVDLTKSQQATRQKLQYQSLKVFAKKGGRGGRGSGGYRAIQTLSTALALQIQRNTELNDSLLNAERNISRLERESVIADQKVRSLTNAILDRSGKKDIRTALEVIAEVTLRTQGGVAAVKGARGAHALISALLADKSDELGLQKRVRDVAEQSSLRPQDLNDNLCDLYNRFASTFHGLDGPVVVVNNGLIPEVNVRAALCLFLDWGKVTYVYVEDGVVINSPYRLPTDPSIEVELGLPLVAIQDWVAENQELLTSKDLAIKKLE